MIAPQISRHDKYDITGNVSVSDSDSNRDSKSNSVSDNGSNRDSVLEGKHRRVEIQVLSAHHSAD